MEHNSDRCVIGNQLFDISIMVISLLYPSQRTAIGEWSIVNRVKYRNSEIGFLPHCGRKRDKEDVRVKFV